MNVYAESPACPEALEIFQASYRRNFLFFRVTICLCLDLRKKSVSASSAVRVCGQQFLCEWLYCSSLFHSFSTIYSNIFLMHSKWLLWVYCLRLSFLYHSSSGVSKPMTNVKRWSSFIWISGHLFSEGSRSYFWLFINRSPEVWIQHFRLSSLWCSGRSLLSRIITVSKIMDT